MSSQKWATSKMANEIHFLGIREKEDFSWERRGSFKLCKDDMKLCLYKNVLYNLKMYNSGNAEYKLLNRRYVFDPCIALFFVTQQ